MAFSDKKNCDFMNGDWRFEIGDFVTIYTRVVSNIVASGETQVAIFSCWLVFLSIYFALSQFNR